MADPFLIAHKVRGEPAFDVAVQMECPECTTWPHDSAGCVECDGLGYWWIIPTSGHRAYPWWHHPFNDIWLVGSASGDSICPIMEDAPAMPEGFPDHYATRAAPTISLTEALGIRPKPQPSAPIIRRF